MMAIDDEKHANKPSKNVKLIATGTILILCRASEAEFTITSKPWKLKKQTDEAEKTCENLEKERERERD